MDADASDGIAVQLFPRCVEAGEQRSSVDRRKFLLQAGAAASLNPFASVLHADDTIPVELRISDDPSAPEVPLTYTGLEL